MTVWRVVGRFTHCYYGLASNDCRDILYTHNAHIKDDSHVPSSTAFDCFRLTGKQPPAAAGTRNRAYPGSRCQVRPGHVRAHHQHAFFDNAGQKRQHASDHRPGRSGFAGATRHLVQTFITAHTPYTPADVAAFSVFTTQAVNPDYTSVQEFVATQGVAVDRNIGLQGRYQHQDCQQDGSGLEGVKLRHYKIHRQAAFPAQRRTAEQGQHGPHSGDRHASPHRCRHLHSLFRTAKRRPLSRRNPFPAHGLRNQSVLERVSLLRQQPGQRNQSHPVFVAAPHTEGREYTSGYQSLNLLTNLTGIESEELAIVLGDFNPFNMGSIEPSTCNMPWKFFT